MITDLKNGVEIRKYSESGYRYLRVSDLGQYGIVNNDPRYVDVEEIPSKIKLTSDSFLISRSGSLGLVSVIDDEIRKSILSSHIFKVDLNTNQILPKYLEALFRSQIGQTQFFQNNNGGVVPEISQSALKSLRIVLPPPEIQNHMAEIMQSADDQKRQKDQDADDLLDSIDDYVLAELGIRMPTLEAKKCFAVYANETAGRRVDPYYHSPYFKKLYSTINNHGQVSSLKNLVRELDYGLMPTQDYADSKDTGVPMIRVTNLLPDGSIDMSEVKYIPFDTPKLNLKRVKPDDILMVQCGSTTGKIALVPKRFEDHTFGSFLFVIRGNREIVNQRYLFAILSNRLIQEQIRHTWNIVTVRPNTSKPNVENLLIPVPTPEIQDRIAKEVMDRKSQAIKLRQKAVEEWEAAKAQFEEQLLSGEVS